jgi:isopentenyl phosphate kinase
VITLIKLGGSLITDKLTPSAFREEAAESVAVQIARHVSEHPQSQLIAGHGSGSFGHVVARRYNTKNGVGTPAEWRGFTKVAAAAAELNALMIHVFQRHGLPAMRFQPSATAVSRRGEIISMELAPLKAALRNGILPVVYGDVCFDTELGGTITSTETIFMYLAAVLPVERIFLLGEVDGVYDQAGSVISRITPSNLAAVEQALGGSAGVDVTGGMESKVRDMVALAQAKTGLQIRIFNGKTPDLLLETLAGRAEPGTLITAD